MIHLLLLQAMEGDDEEGEELFRKMEMGKFTNKLYMCVCV